MIRFFFLLLLSVYGKKLLPRIYSREYPEFDPATVPREDFVSKCDTPDELGDSQARLGGALGHRCVLAWQDADEHPFVAAGTVGQAALLSTVPRNTLRVIRTDIAGDGRHIMGCLVRCVHFEPWIEIKMKNH